MTETTAVVVALWLVAGPTLVFGASGAPSANPTADNASASSEAVLKVEVTGLEPAQVLRGMPVRVIGSGFDQAAEIRVRLNEKEMRLDKPRGDDAKALTFRVPMDARLGPHTVRIVFLRKDKTVFAVLGVPVPSQNDQLRVISDTPEKLKVTSIHPIVGYAEEGRFNFRILGEGFSTVPTDNELILADSKSFHVEWVDDPRQRATEDARKRAEQGVDKTGRVGAVDHDKVYGRVISSRELEFAGIPQEKHQGRLRFQIRVGDSISDPVPATFAFVRKGIPWAAALTVVALLGALVYLPVAWRLRYRIGRRRYGAWSVFLLDQATETLSLSKFQLYVWTAVAVFGYTYLTVARSLIQGVFEFAPIPENLPGIVGISAGTAALAAGVDTARGPKGAGDEHPSLADLITTGGVVGAERFQFLVWTVLGALAFLFLVVFSDPGTIRDLPKIPEGFLYLMGISSAGYLGGKLARKPGPIIDTIVAHHGSIVIDMQGRNLSKQALFTLDDRDLTYDFLQSPSDVPPTHSAKDATLAVIRRDPEASDPDLSLELRLTIKDERAWLAQRNHTDVELEAPDAWLKQPHRLSLMNPDGQKAVLSFAVKPQVVTTPSARNVSTPAGLSASNSARE